jgi:hypothetical protein
MAGRISRSWLEILLGCVFSGTNVEEKELRAEGPRG